MVCIGAKWGIPVLWKNTYGGRLRTELCMECVWIDKPLVIKMEKLHSKKLHSSYILSNIIWVTHAQYISFRGEMRNAYTSLVRNPVIALSCTFLRHFDN
jgi:hypothetical protein